MIRVWVTNDQLIAYPLASAQDSVFEGQEVKVHC